MDLSESVRRIGVEPHRDSGDGWFVAKAGMGSVPVVVVQPRTERAGALLRAGVGTCIGPFAQAGLDQAFGLAVGSRRVRTRAHMAHAQPAHEPTEDAGSVAGAVIGHDPLEVHAQCPIVANGLQQSPAGTRAALVGLDGGEGHA